MPEFIDDKVMSLRTVAQVQTRHDHFERAQELLRKAEELVADEDRFREMGYGVWEMGYGVCKFYVDLAQLHLRIRDLL